MTRKECLILLATQDTWRAKVADVEIDVSMDDIAANIISNDGVVDLDIITDFTNAENGDMVQGWSLRDVKILKRRQE
jgi:hypothetical protein